MAITSLGLSYNGNSLSGLQVKCLGFDTQNAPVYNNVSGTFYYATSASNLFIESQIAQLSYVTFGTVTGYTQAGTRTIELTLQQTPINWANIINKYLYIKYSIDIDGQIFEGYYYPSPENFFGLKARSGTYNILDVISLVGGSYRFSLSSPLEGSSFNKTLMPGFVQQLRVIYDYWDGSKNTHKDLIITNPVYEILDNPSNSAKLISVDNLKYELTDTLGNVYMYEPKLSFVKFLYTDTGPISNLFHKPLEIFGVHGSLLTGGYLWGSSRWGNGGKNLVKINLTNLNDIIYLNVLNPDTGLTIPNIEQMVQIGKYIYCMGDPLLLLQIDSTTNASKVFKVPAIYGGGSSVPILADDMHLYIYQGDSGLIKVKATDLENPNLENGAALPYVDAKKYSNANDGWQKLVHSAEIDGQFLYGAYTTGQWSASKPNYLTKVNKDTLELVSWIPIPKSTDDMTQNDEFLYFGIEVQPNADPAEYGYGWGAFAVRKTDLKIFATNKLGINDDPPRTTSYASLFFGKTLLDSKTNQRIYVLDTQKTDQWSLGWENAPIRRDYSYTIPGGGVINELLLNYDTQTFYGFVWTINTGQRASGFVSFKLPDLVFTSVPTVSTQDPIVVTPNQQYTLRASIDDTGNADITAAGFKVGNSADSLTQDIPVSTATGAKTATLNITDAKSKYYRFYATNSEGTAQTPVRTIEVLDTPLVSIQDPITITPNQQYTLRGSIDGTGGSAVTAAGFKVGNSPSNLTQTISVSISTGSKTANLNVTDAQNKYVQFFATNAQGTRNSDIKTITVAAADEYILKGKVYKDGLVQSGATILLIDITTNQVLQQSTTNAQGEYSFVGLDPVKKYYVAGYYSTYRIVSKLLTSFKKV